MKNKLLCLGLFFIVICFFSSVSSDLLSNASFFQLETVSAQASSGVTPDPNTSSGPATVEDKQSIADTVNILDALLKIIYIILRPLLFIAGVALDNSLVLGEVFHLDTVLRKFWRIMTTFANFALGFVVLFNVIKYAVGTSSDNKELFKIIGKAFLAGIGIQASRFVIMVLLDISTIAIYSVGAMPMNFLGDTIGPKVVLQMDAKMDFDSFKDKKDDQNEEAFLMTYSCAGSEFTDKGNKVSLGVCKTDLGYITGPIDVKGNKVSIMPGYCVLGGAIGENNVIKIPKDTCIPLFDTTKSSETTLPESCKDKTISKGITNASFVQNMHEEPWKCGQLEKMLTESKGFVKVLSTIYSSLLNFANINLAESTITNGAALGIFLLKTLIALALLIPLVALCVVLLVRVVYLWMIIALAPLLVIKEVFFEKVQLFPTIGGTKLGDSFGDVIGVIFMPVATVFALSIGLVLLTVTTEGLAPFGNAENRAQIEQSFGYTSDLKSDEISYHTPGSSIGIELPPESYGLSIFFDMFGYILINLFAIGIMRMVFFAAMKTSESLGKIGGKIDETGRSVMGSLPIIPVPGGGGNGIGVGTLFGGMDRSDSLVGKARSTLVNKYKDLNRKTLDELFDPPKDATISKEDRETIWSNSLSQMGDGFKMSALDDSIKADLGSNYVESNRSKYRSQFTDRIVNRGNDAKRTDAQKEGLTKHIVSQLESASTPEEAQAVLKKRAGFTAVSAKELPESITLESNGEKKTYNLELKDGKIEIKGLGDEEQKKDGELDNATIEEYEKKLSDAENLSGDEKKNLIVEANELLAKDIVHAKDPLKRVDEWEKKKVGTKALLIKYMKEKEGAKYLISSDKKSTAGLILAQDDTLHSFSDGLVKGRDDVARDPDDRWTKIESLKTHSAIEAKIKEALDKRTNDDEKKKMVKAIRGKYMKAKVAEKDKDDVEYIITADDDATTFTYKEQGSNG